MNSQFTVSAARLVRATLITTLITLPALLSLAQTAPSDSPYSIVARGPSYRVLQRTVLVTNSVTGEVSQQVQSYTDLEDGMNYLSTGQSGRQWIEAQDLVEVTPTGAAAVHGQMTAAFSSDITSQGAISLTTAAGEVFQSHPIGLFYADSTPGKVAKIASVQSSVGTLYAPNVIVFSNVLSGLRADLMLVWAKNGYEQNLVLKQNPKPPESFGLSSSTTTLQLWSAMDSCPLPQEQRPVLLDSGLEDHILIFGSAWFPIGAAFAFGDTPLPPAGQAAQVRLIRPSEPGTVPVAKSLVSIAGQQVLIEEVRYIDLAPALSRLPQASLSPKPNQTVELADRGTFLAPRATSTPAKRPMQIASTQYDSTGVVLDYPELSGSANTFTFTNGSTYHIANNFTVGPGVAYLQQNACVKLDTNAWFIAYGNVSCSTSGSPTVFTSRDDNSFGIPMTNSTANPGYAAAEDIWMYYQTVQTTLQNVLVRWAQIGIRYDAQSLNQPHLNSSSFQDCVTGLQLSVGGDTFYLSQDTSCNVPTPLLDESDGGTHISGSLTPDCGVVSVAMVNDPNRDKYDYDTNKNSQTECSFAVLDSTNIVAAFMNTHLSQYGLGGGGGQAPLFSGIPSPRMTSWAVSTNSGASFTDKGPIPPISTITNGTTVITNGAADVMHGDAGDTTMAYDTRSNVVYLLVNTSREDTNYYGFRLWSSKDKGQSFDAINMDVPGKDTSVMS